MHLSVLVRIVVIWVCSVGVGVYARVEIDSYVRINTCVGMLMVHHRRRGEILASSPPTGVTYPSSSDVAYKDVAYTDVACRSLTLSSPTGVAYL